MISPTQTLAPTAPTTAAAPVTPARWPGPRTMLGWAFLFVACLHGVTASGRLASIEDRVQLLVVESMLCEGNLDLDEFDEDLPVLVNGRGERVAPGPPGGPLLMALPYAIARAATGGGTTPTWRAWKLRVAAVSLLGPLSALGTAWLLALSLAHLGLTPARITRAVLIFGVMSVAWPLSRTASSEGAAGFFAALALERLLAHRRGAGSPVRTLLAAGTAGVALGTAACCSPPASVLLVGAVAFLISTRRGLAEALRSLAALGLGLAPSVVLTLAYNQARFDHPLLAGVSWIHESSALLRLAVLAGLIGMTMVTLRLLHLRRSLRASLETIFQSDLPWAIGALLVALVAAFDLYGGLHHIFLSRGEGILLHVPWLVLFPLAAAANLRLWGRVGVIVDLTILLYFLVLAHDAGPAPGTRAVLPILPWIMVAMAASLTRRPRSAPARGTMMALFALAFTLSALRATGVRPAAQQSGDVISITDRAPADLLHDLRHIQLRPPSFPRTDEEREHAPAPALDLWWLSALWLGVPRHGVLAVLGILVAGLLYSLGPMMGALLREGDEEDEDGDAVA